jgi:hypothetical protein
MVYGGSSMTRENIIEAQDYLSIKSEEGFKRIIDIQSLLKRHSSEELIRFLKDWLRQKEDSLRNMILTDKTDQKVDQIVSSMFRVRMAIKSLEKREEVKIIERLEQGAEKSRRFYKRDRRRDHWTGRRKDFSDDGKDRKSGQKIQRAA